MSTQTTKTSTSQEPETSQNSSELDSETKSQTETVGRDADSQKDDWGFLSSKLADDEAEAEFGQLIDEADDLPVTPKKDETSEKEEEVEAETAEAEEEEPEAAAEEATSETEEPEAEATLEPDYDEIRRLLGDAAADAIKAVQTAKPEQTTEQAATAEQTTQQQVDQTQQQPVPPNAQLQEMRTKALQEFSSQFELTEDEIEEFREDPNKVLPQKLSQALLNTFETLMQGIQRQLPAAVAQVVDMKQRTAEGERTFYTVWPQLNKPQYRTMVNRIADAYVQANPDAPMDKRLREIGAQAWISAQLPLDQLTAHVQKFAAPAAPAPKIPKKTFRKPAGAGNVPAGRVADTQPKSEWDSFIDEFIENPDFD